MEEFNPNGPNLVPEPQYRLICYKNFYDHQGDDYFQRVDGYFSPTELIHLNPFAADCISGKQVLRKKDYVSFYKEITKIGGINNSIDENDVIEHVVKMVEYELLRDEVYDKVQDIMKEEGFKSCYIMYSTNRKY